MATKRRTKAAAEPLLTEGELVTESPVGGVTGPGSWLCVEYLPVSLFSLKMSSATSGVGRTLLVPTPYAIKMAFLDAGLRSGRVAENEADSFVRALAGADLRVRVPEEAIVTHTIVKIRQEPKDKKKTNVPYGPNIAYREFVYLSGHLGVVVDLRTVDLPTATRLIEVCPMVSYFGKRGGFFQFTGIRRQGKPDIRCCCPVGELVEVPSESHLAILDDFGPEASFDALNSFSETPIKRDRHRKFVSTVVPLGRRAVGPGFTHYRH